MVAEGRKSIEVEELTRKFGSFTAVDRISFEVEEGAVWGFLGANGAGKTTAIRMLTGLLPPSSGKGRVAGYDIRTESEGIKKRIGYMCQRFALYDDLTVRENIRFYGGVYGLKKRTVKERGEKLLSKLGLSESMDAMVGQLPLGWKQKLAFSLATIHHPSIVFLDEPTSGVDPITRRQFWEMIYETASQGVTVLVTTHYMDEAEYCDMVSIMVDGRIEALDSPLALKEQHEVGTMNELFLKLTR